MEAPNGDHAHKYRLVYFDLKGRGEPIRLLFRYFDVSFIDYRVGGEEWATLKAESTMEQLPILEIDDGKKTLSDSMAITRYLAKVFSSGFLGRSRTAAAAVDMHMSQYNDLFFYYAFLARAKGEHEKEKATEQFERSATRFLRCHEKIISANQSHLVLVGSELTLADLYVFYMLWILDDMECALFSRENQPVLMQFYEKMRELPSIAVYISEQWPSKILA